MKKLKLEKIESFQHVFNPEHMYFRLIEMGLEESSAVKIKEEYNNLFYIPLSRTLHELYFKEVERCQ